MSDVRVRDRVILRVTESHWETAEGHLCACDCACLGLTAGTVKMDSGDDSIPTRTLPVKNKNWSEKKQKKWDFHGGDVEKSMTRFTEEGA